MSLPNGARLGPYEIVAFLGAGGMGEVYHAHDPRLDRRVAVKVLPAPMASDPEARERLRREAMAAASLEHPFICKVLEIAEDGATLYMVMEFVDGETLYRRLRGGPCQVSEAARIAGEVAEALEAAHKRGFVHRDLKPANVMLTPDGHVKVMDFGLAKRAESTRVEEDPATLTSVEAPLTAHGMVVGTPDYMSPEQVKGEPLDQRSDMFSFGILLCELLTCRHPFRRGSSTETMAAILRDPPNVSGELPQGLILLIRRLLAKRREERYPSMIEVRADLGRLATASGQAPAMEMAAQTRIPLIGREQERTELTRLLVEALAGRGSLVMIGGEPGIGKTHLAEAILAEARRRGAFALTGHCYEMEGAPPYVPFIEMLEYISRVAPRESFRCSIGDAAPEVAKLMPELRRIYPDIPPPVQLPPEQQRRFLFNAYREFVERAARVTPIVAVFEDLHWADEPTLLLFQHLAQAVSAAPILMIGTYRDVELDVTRPFAKTLETLVRQKQARRMSLRRLALGGVEGMLAALSGQKPPPSLARVVFEETEGNPFFVEEVFRHLSEEAKLFDESGAWRPDLRVDELQVPEGVRLVLGRRLERLGEQARRVLTTAAVIGRSFSLRLLEELESKQPDAALDALEEAERAHLVAAEPAGREARYRFVHELVRQTLAQMLSLPRRQRLHARVADAIERVYASHLESQASALAHHLYQAGAAADPEKTTAYLVLAARQARLGAAHEEALAHLDHALSLWEGERGARVAELLEQKAGTLSSLGRSDGAVEAYRQAITMFEESGEQVKAAQAGIPLAMVHGWRSEPQFAVRSIEHALEHLRGADPALECRLMLAQAVALGVGGDVAAAARNFKDAKALQRNLSIRDLEAFADSAEAHHSFQSVQWERCIEVSRRAARYFRAAGDAWHAADVEWMQLLAMVCGRPGEAAGLLADAKARAERIGHHNAVWCCNRFLPLLSLARGDLAAAERELEGTWSFGESHQIAWRFLDDVSRGHLALLRGRPEEAGRWFRRGIELEGESSWSGTSESSLFAALAETGDDRAWEAWTGRRWKLPVAGQLNSAGAWMALTRSVAGLASLGKREEAAALQPLAEELVATGVWTFAQLFPFHTVAGIAAACARDWSCSEQHHQTAIHQTDTAPYRILQPMARECYAEMLLARGAAGDEPRARVLQSEAQAMYDSMGIPKRGQ